MSRLVLHAPGVRTGGGLVLLQQLLSVPDSPLAFATLDARAVPQLAAPPGAIVHPVAPSLAGRLRAELLLARQSRAGDRILCFHGMPPIRRLAGKVTVFLQNRHYFGLEPASSFDGRTRLRLPLERLICRAFRHHVDEYIVQTPHMASATRTWHRGDPRVRIIPYLDIEPTEAATESVHDFIYVADGEAHKNHRNLLAAWRLLAQEGLRPSLGLTLEGRFGALLSEIDAARRGHDLRIANLGALRREEVLRAYGASRALIFPSISESFGLPLVEAARAGLPVIAPELDYVRDVCEPAQTFDPRSPVSIARAVRRFLGVPQTRERVRSASEFLREVMQ